jgi:hypothetical protein
MGKKSKRTVRLNVKLATEVEPGQAEEALAGTPGLRSLIRMFPDEEDEELSRLFILEVDPSTVQQSLKQLKKNLSVEYAEKTASRKLVL